jgi:hypothetical protein
MKQTEVLMMRDFEFPVRQFFKAPSFTIAAVRVWLGAESNRRHVDFQSTALPTELPSQMPPEDADGH